MEQKNKLTKDAARVLKIYASLVEKLKRYPTSEELAKAEVTRNMWRHHFLTVEGIRKEARKAYPKVFENLFSSDDFTPARFRDTREALRDVDEFIICTAVSGQNIFEPAYKALQTWMKKTDGLALFTPQKDTASKGQQGGSGKDSYFFDPLLKGAEFVWKDLKLNNKVTISDFQVSAKQLNPHMGAERIADKSGLLILASPQTRLTPLANMDRLPGYIVSGGAITIGKYSTDMHRSLRTAKLARSNHRLGGVYVKLLGKNKYEFTPIQFDSSDGHFTLDGVRYFADGKAEHVNPAVIDFGDIHAQELSFWMRRKFFQILKDKRPKRIGLHDVFSGITINPFNTRKKEYQFLENKEYGATTLKAELENTGRLLNDAAKLVETVDVIDSNHHKFLEFWIAGGNYRLGDPENIHMAHKIADAWLSDPHTPILETALRCAGIKLEKNILFHKSYKSLKFKGIERQHGHASSSGMKGFSLEKINLELGPSNTMHRHYCAIVGDAWCGGTFSGVGDRRPNYAKQGANKQANAYIEIYDDGLRTLTHVFED